MIQTHFGRILLIAICVFRGPADVYADELSPLSVDRVFVKHIQMIQVPATQPGALKEILVKEGEFVRKGQVLARLKEEAVQLTRQRVATKLRIAEKQSQDETLVLSANKRLEQAKQALKQNAMELEIEKQLAANQLKVQAAEQAQALAANELRRAEQAKRDFNDSVSQSELDNLKLAQQRTTIDAQQAAFEQNISKQRAAAAAEAYKATELSVEQLGIEADHATAMQVIHQLQADLSRVELAEAELAIEQHQLRAPLDGIVLEKYRDVGEWLEAGAAVVRILRLDRLRVEGYLPIRGIRFELAGARVSLRIEAESQQILEFEGQITFVNPQVDSVNGDVMVWAEFDNPNYRAKPGLQGKMLIHPPSPAKRD